MLQECVNVLDQAVREGAFPGAVLIVDHAGVLIHQSAHGNLGSQANTPATLQTWYDLASLTKILATVPLYMLAVSKGFDLNWPLAALLPDIKDKRLAASPFEYLLEHRSGLPAWLPLYKNIPQRSWGSYSAREMLFNILINLECEAVPGERELYSDLDFMLLGFCIEKYFLENMDTVFMERIANPLKADLAYSPMENPFSFPTGVAPTQNCPDRHRVLEGEVHDLNAYVAGGVMGHAGLFGTAFGCGRVGREILNAWMDKRSIFANAAVKKFAIKKDSSRRFALGFDTPDEIDSQAGEKISKRSIGHWGFTGTGMWLDPDRNLAIVLLTNRIHPDTDNQKITQIRPKVFDAIIEEHDERTKSA